MGQINQTTRKGRTHPAAQTKFPESRIYFIKAAESERRTGIRKHNIKSEVLR